MDKRFLSILGAIVVIFIGVFVITQHSSNKTKNTSTANTTSQGTNHVMGENAKKVTIVEYGDYQCPICEAYFLPVKQAVDTHIKDIKFQFKNLPLTQIHQNAFAGARAAEAASLQGKFWEMHDLLYQQINWTNWTNSTNPTPLFENYAKSLGLNGDKFRQDYASDQVNSLINADLAQFDKTGKEKATPTFFVNGVFVENTALTTSTGEPTVDSVSQFIQSQIDKSSAKQ
jgi:protein-disulfide isomerase